ncbi:MAG: hypothetical protein PSX80_17365, partial [bacterium]|nr:hypothetical protein [bacterium]
LRLRCLREVDRGIFDGGSGRAEHQNVYTTNDHFGSPRINTAATGQVISRRNYHSFGEAIAPPSRATENGQT